MKTKIISQQKNPFLERQEFLLEINSETMPTKEQIIQELGKDQNLTIINKINSQFGLKKFIAEICVYETKEAKEKNQTITRKQRKKQAEEIKKELEEQKKKKAEEKAQKEAEEKAKKESEEKAQTDSQDAKEVKQETQTDSQETKQEDDKKE